MKVFRGIGWLRLASAAMAALALGAGQAAAQAKPRLTVYTYTSFAGKYGPGATIKERFEAECGCTLDWVASDDAGTLLSRLKLEGSGTRADVVLGLDQNLVAEARATGLFAPHEVDLAALDLPVPWSDDTFVPFDWGWHAFVYDSTRLAAPPASFRDLVEAEDGPTLVVQDPRTSAPGLGLLLWVRSLYGEEAAGVWRKLAPRIVTVTKGWSEAYGLFLKGEADMVLSYSTSPAYHIGAENETKYRAAIFPEGHYMQVEVAAATAASKNPDLARGFLRFMLSNPFQSAIPEGNWMYPAVEPEGGLPASFADLPAPEKSLLMTPEEVREHRRPFVDEWLDAMSR
ncbi:thiamine ABC transporter substrate binding subunit [Faunimonas sp. B44]|uniref:thiamine ABC transporter substrate binding subunit n=1 Tax=Faunimonas sp. B44 TaxID=3461493 RepID=UPI0040441FBD